MKKEKGLTMADAINFIEILRSIKSYTGLTPEGGLILLKNSALIGRIVKEHVEEPVKELVDKLRTDEFVKLEEPAERIKAKKDTERTDEEKATLKEYEDVSKKIVKEVNATRDLILKDQVTIAPILKISEKDFSVLMMNEKNNDNITVIGFELLYEHFVTK